MISNFRDLGGLQNKEGRIIPSGRLYRSANLHRATEDDLAGISAVIDLRTETERQRMPDQIPDGIAYHHIPIFDEAAAGITREMSLTSVPDMVLLYRQMEEACQDAVNQVLAVICGHDYSSGGILWHCTAGKDRCGVISAHILSALGVDEKTIMSDYMKSNDSCIPEANEVFRRMRDEGTDESTAKGVWNAFIAKEEYLQSALAVMSFKEDKVFQRTIFD